MRERLAALEAVMPTLATKADLADQIGGVRAAIEGVRSDIRGWMLATVLAVIGTMLAAIFGVSQIMKAPAFAAPQPTIVVVPPAPTPVAPR